jgi:hydrogenase maturation protein HypF
VWRLGLAALHDAFGPDAERVASRLELFADIPPDARHTIGRMLVTGVGTVQARGMGRWFDAIGALALDLPQARFEGQVAMALEEAARGELGPAYPVDLPRVTSPDRGVTAEHEIDLRPTVRAVIADRLEGVPARTIAARFHRTIVEATAATIGMLDDSSAPVVLTGGSFQNRLLERGLRDALGARVAIAREVPVNDGGISLGQAWAGVLALTDTGKEP